MTGIDKRVQLVFFFFLTTKSRAEHKDETERA